MSKYLRSLPTFSLALVVALSGCGGSSGSDSDSSASCATPGPGAAPSSGSGSFNDPYIITPGVSYGGCATEDADPGPVYAATVSAGTYTVRQTNGSTDLELWIYQGDGTQLDVIDDMIAGFDESRSYDVQAGTYGVEVFNNGPGDGPFTLTIEGPL
jgi:hypothetical protein